jgi:protein TonB
MAITPGWQNALAAWLEAHKTYPDAARRQGEQGRAIVRFTIDRGGQVLDVQLVSGTGSASLDEAVERMLRGARLPVFPPGMDQAQVTVTVQIRYRLE